VAVFVRRTPAAARMHTEGMTGSRKRDSAVVPVTAATVAKK
jgi:hypothetical protein